MVPAEPGQSLEAPSVSSVLHVAVVGAAVVERDLRHSESGAEILAN